ncbi:MAG: FHA domain-containing protein [Dehalococcoidia bacterium]|nr:FHA domain-containing protein [Dehalococcoidia bacterium]MCB9484953.1 FHA domain-containing protein [Thermoflexaceae bacterium]
MSLQLAVTRAGTVDEYDVDGAVYVGRAADNHIVLDGPAVSRRHARFDRAGDDVRVVDLGSANGTTVNGREIEPRAITPLTAGDVVAIGGFTIRAVEPRPGSATVVLAPGAGGMARAGQKAHPWLEVTTPAGTIRYRLADDVVHIGRSSDNEMVIPEPVVSKRHAVVRRSGDTHLFEDLGSANGTYLGDERIRLRQLVDGDSLSIGETVTVVFRAEDAEAPPVAGASGVIAPSDHALLVGRDADCDIVLDHPAISRKHARLGSPAKDGSRLIEDLGSANGTFVEGNQVMPGAPAVAAPGSSVRVGPLTLEVQAGGWFRDPDVGLSLTGAALRQEAGKGVTLLQDISLDVRPREFIAIVGVSGAGKTTLLKALAGMKRPSGGRVLIDGVDLYSHPEAFRSMVGFVPQDDILHKELPVRKALEYTASLRLPEDTSRAERAARVASVITALGLDDRTEVPSSKLSGGQRKRVSIAAELLTRPGLFFLDEATSGLDPGTEGQLMRQLRQLADDGHTVVLITHATKNVMMCDKVAFLARGGYLVFYGPPEDALVHFGVEDFDGIYDRLEGEMTPEAWAAQYMESPAFAAFSRPAIERSAEAAATGSAVERRRGASWIRQFWVLSERYLDIVRRDRLNFAILALIAPVIGMIFLVAWPRDVLDYQSGDPSRAFVMAFLVSLMPFIIGAVSATREIVKEAPVYLRERAVSLRVGPYVGSKVAVVAVLSLWHALALTVFWALGIDFPGADFADYLKVYVSVFLVLLSGSVLGLLISAISPREEQAILFAIGLIIVQIVFSGGILPLGDTGIAGKVIGSATSTNWGFRAVMASTGIDGSECEGESLTGCALPGFGDFDTEEKRQVAVKPLEDRYGEVWAPDLAVTWGAMLAIIVVVIGGTYVVQRRKDPR